jgi:hypothetical protein
MNYTDKIQKLIEAQKTYKYNIYGKRVSLQTKAILIGLFYGVLPSIIAKDFGISTTRVYQIKAKYKI